MALTVEDGTGVTGAESYAAVDDLTAHAAKYALTVPTSTTAEQEAALRNATRYIDGLYRFDGVVSDLSQPLSWPRAGVITREGREIPSNAIPRQLVEAACELAVVSLTEALDPDRSEVGIKSKRTKVDVIEEEIEYTGAKPARKDFPTVARLLAEITGRRAGAGLTTSRG